jgi:hypothetical protein
MKNSELAHWYLFTTYGMKNSELENAGIFSFRAFRPMAKINISF